MLKKQNPNFLVHAYPTYFIQDYYADVTNFLTHPDLKSTKIYLKDPLVKRTKNNFITATIQHEHGIKKINNVEKIEIQNWERLKDSDLIFEYSYANYKMLTCKFPEYREKVIYLPPGFKQFKNKPSFKDIQTQRHKEMRVITTFSEPLSEKRSKLMRKLSPEIDINNISGKFTNLFTVYKPGDTLINLGQTNEYIVREDMRILPALLAGCRVVTDTSSIKIDGDPFDDYMETFDFSDITGLKLKIAEKNNVINYEKMMQSFAATYESAYAQIKHLLMLK